MLTVRQERAANLAYSALIDAGAACTWYLHPCSADHTPDLGPLAVVWAQRAPNDGARRAYAEGLITQEECFGCGQVDHCDCDRLCA